MSHVFVVHGDLMKVACDAWLVPGGRGPGGTWLPGLPPKRKRLPLPADWGAPGTCRACLLAEVADDEPLPFLCDIVAFHDRLDPSWWVDGARDFVRVAAETLARRGRGPAHQRARRLLALPLVGTGGGGASHLSGELVNVLLRALREEAARAGVDIALVLLDGPAWAAAQNQRKGHAEAWPELSAELAARADALARMAQSGDLVLFLGAGVSRAAGLPGWSGLIKELATELRLVRPDEMPALDKLGELDRAALLERRLPGDESIGVMVARLLSARQRRHGLGHALLASLPVDEIVTTNYDAMFEIASERVGRPCTILPGSAVAHGERWILKMHGRLDRPETIVLTRQDYLRFQENRTALAGIVQALLLTRHMLFVGFSLSDDNFHRIAHAVRQAIGDRQRIGTSLVVDPNPLARELWDQDLEWVTFDQGGGGIPEQSRLLEIFLDRLACHAAATTSHLWHPQYDAALSDGERALRDRLTRFLAEATPAERETAAWSEVARLLKRLGMDR
jgi:hypothetical protein